MHAAASPLPLSYNSGHAETVMNLPVLSAAIGQTQKKDARDNVVALATL
jgi:hypothetical protein